MIFLASKFKFLIASERFHFSLFLSSIKFEIDRICRDGILNFWHTIIQAAPSILSTSGFSLSKISAIFFLFPWIVFTVIDDTFTNDVLALASKEFLVIKPISSNVKNPSLFSAPSSEILSLTTSQTEPTRRSFLNEPATPKLITKSGFFFI